MSERVTVDIDLNRVEGDLEFQLDLQDGKVVDARCKGIMYRGFEQLLIGRDPKDSIVITARVCGICGTAHMYTAVLALEQIWNAEVPRLATLVRNLCLAAENVQSDMRHSFLMFTPDFCNEKYAQRGFFEDAERKYSPFKGEIYREVLRHSRKILEIVAIFGGQWPHSSYMVPGGIVTEPDSRKVIESQSLLYSVKQWFEQRVVGEALASWETVNSVESFEAWLTEHPDSVIANFTAISRELGLDKIGAGADLMLSYGAYDTLDSGTYDLKDQTRNELDQRLITEHVAYSWFKAYENGLHPSQGQTIPDFDTDSNRYTWAKAPRYDERVTQTGPLAELVIGGDPLLTALLSHYGDSAWLRQLARILRIGAVSKAMLGMLDEINQRIGEPHILPVSDEQKCDGSGFGLIQAARGALGHWITIEDGKVSRYQIVTPTAWNASPKDAQGQPGHWERSVIGMELDDPDNPVEIGHVVRSHDACLVCTVHMLDDQLKTSTKQTFQV